MSSFPQYSVRSTTELILAFEQLNKHFKSLRLWWRGQAKAGCWKLVPSVYRNNHARNEAGLIHKFQKKARARHVCNLENTDYAGWLFLAQHYRLPTRLLDWSEAALIGLFFAVESPEYDNLDGVLWAVEPMALRAVHGEAAAIPLSDDQSIASLCEAAFTRDHKEDPRILPVFPEQRDVRHMTQQSTFTVHGCQDPLDGHPNADRFLARINIPRIGKGPLREWLGFLGISRSVLFPDLENLAAELRTDNWASPVPPPGSAGARSQP